MAFLTKTDLTTIIYEEDIDVMTEGDDTKVTGHINTAITEATGYLDRYDTPTLFAREGDEKDPLLMESCKAIACWYLVAACPANQNTKDITERANVARLWLSRVQAGKVKPVGWPLKTEPTKSTYFHASSLPKRRNNY